MVSQNPWYVLAQIFAILSGTWMVAAGMWMNYSLFMVSAAQNNLEMSAYGLNNSELACSITNLTKGFIGAIEPGTKMSYAMSGTGVIFAFLAILSWMLGHIKRNSFA